MHNFFDLVGYEYKKILKRKSVWVMLVLGVLIAVVTCAGILIGDYYQDGIAFESQYEGMIKDRTYARKLAGRLLDKDLLIEAAEGYRKVPTEGEYYFTTKEYQTYARPYSKVRMYIRGVYDKSIASLTEEDASNFYTIRDEKLKKEIADTHLNEQSKQKLNDLNAQIKKPFVYDYIEGYDRFLVIMYTTAIIGSFIAAICVAPIFAGEYTSGADQLVLASIHGKKTLIWAKIFTGISLSTLFCLSLIVITYLQCMFTYGFDGADAVWQLLMPMSPYPLTIGEVALIFVICILCANLFCTMVTLFLSAKLKTPFGVTTIIVTIIIAPMFISIPQSNVMLYNLFNLMPSNMMEVWRVTSPILYEIFNISVQPYILMPVFAVIATSALIPFTYYGFKKHQIG